MASLSRHDSPSSLENWQKVSFSTSVPEYSHQKQDAGALIVLEARGDWYHAGYHMCSAIVGPPLLSLPFAISFLGWYGGIFALLACGMASMYAYRLLSLVLDRAAEQGHRQIRYRDVAQYILGQSWAFYTVAFGQLLLCFGSVSTLILLSGTILKAIYRLYHPDGEMPLYQFITMFGALIMLVSQLPSFHSLRHINFAATFLSLTFSAIAIGGCIYAGHSAKAPAKDYSIPHGGISKVFNVFNAIAIITATYGNAIVPEIQATIAPPVAGKMMNGLILCYSVVWSTYLSVGISGYWTFGNKVSGNVLFDLSPLIPRGLWLVANLCTAIQLTSGTLVYMQPCFDILESKSADAKQGKFSRRNLVPRIVLRSLFVALATFLAAMFPFIGDALAIIGAFGFIPLDYILPFIFYIIVFKPSLTPVQYWMNSTIAATFTIVGVLAGVGSVRQLVLDSTNYKLFANI